MAASFATVNVLRLVSTGLHFVLADRDLNDLGWTPCLAWLDYRWSEQRNHLLDCGANLADRIHSGKPILSRAVRI